MSNEEFADMGMVAPLRARGLKRCQMDMADYEVSSRLYGRVD